MRKTYKFNSYQNSVNYWKRYLKEKVLSMFEYQNLPQSLPYKELEYRLVNCGFCGVFNHDIYGLVTSDGGISGIDIYNHATQFTYSQALLGSKTLNIDEDAVVIYNSFSDTNFNQGYSIMINRYAILLAQVEISLYLALINTRTTNTYFVKNSDERNALNRFYEDIEIGKITTILNPNASPIMENIKNLSQMHDIKNVPELIKARRDIIANFYEEIGVHHKRDKVAEMTAEEVSEDIQTLVVNQTTMLEMRQEGVEKINKIFGTKITVKIRDEYNPERKNDNEFSRLFNE